MSKLQGTGRSPSPPVNKWSEMTIGALIGTWRAPPVPRRRAGRWELCFAATRHGPNVERLLVRRLRGTAALQVKNSHPSFRENLAPFHRSTLPPFHPSTLPPFHPSTLPPFHPSTLSPYSAAACAPFSATE